MLGRDDRIILRVAGIFKKISNNDYIKLRIQKLNNVHKVLSSIVNIIEEEILFLLDMNSQGFFKLYSLSLHIKC